MVQYFHLEEFIAGVVICNINAYTVTNAEQRKITHDFTRFPKHLLKNSCKRNGFPDRLAPE